LLPLKFDVNGPAQTNIQMIQMLGLFLKFPTGMLQAFI
jgi:hypothetical protein